MIFALHFIDAHPKPRTLGWWQHPRLLGDIKKSVGHMDIKECRHDEKEAAQGDEE
jgi:hypothetical protein